MSPAADKRRAILDAALDLFVERGFHGTAVPGIAARAGVGAGTIYRYFDSKEALGNALYQLWKQRISASILDGFPFSAPAREQFQAFFHNANVFLREHPRAMAFLELHHHGDWLDATSRAIEEQLLCTAYEVVEQWRAQQVVKDLPPELLMAMVWGGLVGVHQAAWLDRIALDDDRLAATERCLWEAIRR